MIFQGGVYVVFGILKQLHQYGLKEMGLTLLFFEQSFAFVQSVGNHY